MKKFRLAEYSIAAAILLVSGWEWSRLWSDVILPARETARRKQCHNDLFQHSGCHSCDVAQLDRDQHVVAVGSCPICTGTIAQINYVLPDGAKVNEAKLPFATVFDAKRKLLSYKSKPRYRQISDSIRPERETMISIQN